MLHLPQLALLVAVLAFLISSVHATALTIKVAANDKQCFYSEVVETGAIVGFYFAVQSGGAFDIDIAIKSPDGQIEYSEAKQKQGEFSFAAQEGEYEFCFSNDMSTFAAKSVEFEINVESERKDENDMQATLPSNIADKEADKIEEYIVNLESRSSNLLRTLQYYKTRNNRNQSTVKSTQDRIFWFSFLDLVIMVGMAILHVIIVQLFFTGCKCSFSYAYAFLPILSPY